MEAIALALILGGFMCFAGHAIGYAKGVRRGRAEAQRNITRGF